jgi:hypothetical protein
MTEKKQNPIKTFNDWLAIKITNAVGSMWCAYIFAVLAFISLPAAIASHNLIIIVSWIAQTFLQLVLLAIILKGQNISGERLEKIIMHIEHLAEVIEQNEEKEIFDIESKQ